MAIPAKSFVVSINKVQHWSLTCHVSGQYFAQKEKQETGVRTAKISSREKEDNEKSIVPVFAALHDSYAGAVSHWNRPR
jgi:hypothetical protein